MKIFALYFMLSLLFLNVVSAQTTKMHITGTVITKNGVKVSANLKFTSLADTSFVKTVSTNQEGNYVLESLPRGKFTVEVKAVGYQSIKETFEPFVGKTTLDLSFNLQAEIKELESVVITGRKPLIERHNDKTVMNVENSIVSSGNTALEVLAKMPGVSVNQDGVISIRGRSGVNVLIDGKSTYLSAEQLATRLRSLNSNEIKTIELITSPSSKYDAEGNAGLLNIKLKKNANYGTNGNIDLGFGYGENPKSDAGISINHRNKSLNLYGSFANNNNKATENLDILRVVNGSDQNTYFHQSNTQTRSSHNNNYKAGIDYFITDKNTLGFLTTGYFNNGHDLSNGLTAIGQSFTKVDSSIVADNPSKNKYRNQAYNLNYKSVMDTLGQELSIDLDYAKYHSEENTVYQNSFFEKGGSSYKSASIFRNATPSFIKIKAAKIDYTIPFNAKTKLDVGLKSSWVSTDNDFQFENFTENGWKNDISRSNHFIYDENINAAYATLKCEFKSTSIEIGLRTEQTNSKGNSINDSKIVKRSYFDFFPSFNINQTLNPNNEIGFSYSRRIDRPDYKSLNPFVYFVDLYTFSQGNPFLNPQYTNTFQVSYNYKKTLNISFGYSTTNNLIIDVLLPDNEKKTLYQTVKNLDKQYAYDLTIGYPTTITKFWSMDNTLTSTYNQIKTANLGDGIYDRKKVNFTGNSSHNFTLSPSTAAELSGEYASSQIYGTYAIKPYYGIDFGIKKSFLDKKLNVKLTANDVFNTRKARISSALSGLDYNLTQKQESRVYRLSLNYIFGSSSIKGNRERKTSVTDEEGRIK
ncbi:TonB-dependent receptor [Pedobacter sp. ISL-68]|uniref:outer membrane beta-barrel family protein n=1 Tax=unclassified Pedobacter TaxID=2628915 RepID=UPI001BE61BD6|nr:MULTISPECIES: outer membrane beta-barrel family protein [unclassified Pedobacter]MBT2563505.1 TonB-dependent receptor [Pedobacter sp. ISL-64]MBT2592875.1 TonB-dependent receptor [Pedobacter sp. ISL-68]